MSSSVYIYSCYIDVNEKPMSCSTVEMQTSSCRLFSSLPSSLVLVFYVTNSQVKLSNISVSSQGWGKSYLLSCVSIIHKMFNKCMLFINKMESVL